MINYINKQLEAGYSRAEIEKALIDAGWSKEEISASFDSLSGSEDEKSTVTGKTDRSSSVGLSKKLRITDKKKPIIISLALILLFSLSVFGGFYLSGEDDSEEKDQVSEEVAEEEEGLIEEEEDEDIVEPDRERPFFGSDAGLLAEEWIKTESPTFTERGGDNLRLLDTEEVDESVFEVSFSFEPTYSGYGPVEEGEDLEEAESSHVIVITIDRREVVEAVIDDEFKELNR